jgi:hypothetical protein
MPAVYFSIEPLQVVSVILILLAFGGRNQSHSLDERVLRLISRAKSTIQVIRVSTKQAVSLLILISFVLTVFSTSYLIGWIYNTNYGHFVQSFYGSVPTSAHEEREMYQWIYMNSNQSDVILCDAQNWEIPALIGRQIFYSGYRDPDENSTLYQAYFAMYNSSTMSEVLPLFLQYDVTLVVVSPLEKGHFPFGCMKFYATSNFELVYSNGNYQVFHALF